MHVSHRSLDGRTQEVHIIHRCSNAVILPKRGKALRRLKKCIARSQAQQENLQLFSPSKVICEIMQLQHAGDCTHLSE